MVLFGLWDGLSASDLADECFNVIGRDRRRVLDRVDDYLNGRFVDPYSPKQMSRERREMMKRAMQPWCDIPVKAATQALQVDGFRPGDAASNRTAMNELPEWNLWQRSGLDARQSVVHSAAIAYGHSFVLVALEEPGRARVQVLNPLDTTVLYEDPVSDDNPVFALTIIRRPKALNDGSMRPGLAYGWDRENRYTFALDDGLKLVATMPHGGNGLCPVTRFVCDMDATGRTRGVVEPIIPWQDMFNQTLFEMLVAQSFDANRILYATGFVAPPKVDEKGNPVLDAAGKPVPGEFSVAPGSFIGTKNTDAKFGQIAGSNQSNYVTVLDMLIKDFGALSQTPPNFFLGQMSNLSAEALEATERDFRRRVDLYARNFGEAWERVLRVGMVLEGRPDRDGWERNEILWRDLDRRALSKVADGLSKIAESLQVPPRGLWQMIPGVSPNQLDEWEEMRAEDKGEDLLSGALQSYRDYNTLDSSVVDESPTDSSGGGVEAEL